MSGPTHAPAVFGLFEKRFAGDDALLELAKFRFQQSGLGAEIHTGTAEDFDRLMKFRPSAAPVMVHLPRELNLVREADRDRVAALAAHVTGQVLGFVMHDHAAMTTQSAEYMQAGREMDSRLNRIAGGPILFIEYAAGLDPDKFAEFFAATRDLTKITACIDIGHVGIREIRHAYAAVHHGEEICDLKNLAAWTPELLSDIEAAVRLALPRVLKLIEILCGKGKPLHFHLHDGHPLSTFSPFGVSDHLSFLAEIPLGSAFRGGHSLPLMFGAAGLSQIVGMALDQLEAEQVSFTLEIHPTGDRLCLDDARQLFDHWRDKSHAEQMNHWLSILTRNHHLLAAAPAQKPRTPGSS